VLENESLSVVWYALHPKEEVTVQVVVRVENIVVCVDVIVCKSHSAAQPRRATNKRMLPVYFTCSQSRA
jgi:hypothetical protein